MRGLLSLLLMVLLTNSLVARTYFVNNMSGDNRNTGVMETNAAGREGPLRTIAAALRKASRGDRISIAATARPYQECLTLQGPRNSGTAFSPFILEGNGATLDGANTHPVGITLYDVEHVLVRNLQVRGFQLDGVNAHDNAFDCALVHVICSENKRSGFSIGGASRLQVVDCRAHRNETVQLRTEGWSTTRLSRTNLVATEGPAWVRHADPAGHGARLIVEGTRQQALAGYSTQDDLDALLAWEQQATSPAPPPSSPATADSTAAMPTSSSTAAVTDPFVDEDLEDPAEDAAEEEMESSARPPANELAEGLPADDGEEPDGDIGDEDPFDDAGLDLFDDVDDSPDASDEDPFDL